MTVAEDFARHVLETRLSDLSEAAKENAAIYILDSLGVGIAGSSVEGAEDLLRVASGWGRPATTVWGRSARLAPPAAVFINAWQMHNQEFDCLHEGAVVHAMASVLPAALAAAELRGGVTGSDLIIAVAVGVDIAAGLGLASRSRFRFFRPATAGGFGAVAAAGRILALDADTLKAAFAWQLAQVSGTMQAHVEGSPILPVQVAFNARAAMQSCEFAALDFQPAASVFEGQYGYLPIFEGDFDLAPILGSLGREWRIAEFSHKPFPAGRATHAGIEGVLALQAAHTVSADDIARIEVFAPPLIVSLVGRKWQPGANPSYARLCMGYAVAKVLQFGRLDLADFRGSALADPVTDALAALVDCRSDDNPDPNALAPQKVVVHLKNGTVLRWQCDVMLANPARPLTTGQHLAKFYRCCSFAAEPLAANAPAQLQQMVANLESLRDVSSLLRLVSSPGG